MAEVHPFSSQPRRDFGQLRWRILDRGIETKELQFGSLRRVRLFVGLGLTSLKLTQNLTQLFV